MNTNNYIVGLNQVGIHDIDRVGGKNASLGEMLQHLTAIGIRIPNGFVITVGVYKKFIEANNLDTVIRKAIGEIDFSNIESLRRGGIANPANDPEQQISAGTG